MIMRPLTFAILLATVLVSGCASHPVDCSKGAGQNGCLPGTDQYEQMKMEQEDAQTTAEIDDARCQSYGARGTPAYADCRRRASSDLGESSRKTPSPYK
jgi:hypothetical protein